MQDGPRKGQAGPQTSLRETFSLTFCHEIPPHPYQMSEKQRIEKRPSLKFIFGKKSNKDKKGSPSKPLSRSQEFSGEDETDSSQSSPSPRALSRSTSVSKPWSAPVKSRSQAVLQVPLTDRHDHSDSTVPQPSKAPEPSDSIASVKSRSMPGNLRSTSSLPLLTPHRLSRGSVSTSTSTKSTDQSLSASTPLPTTSSSQTSPLTTSQQSNSPTPSPAVTLKQASKRYADVITHIRNPDGCYYFRKFLQKRHCEENIAFYLEVCFSIS